MGRSSWDHAQSAVSTSAGVLRTVKARQQRSPNDNPRPPGRDRSAPASSASASVNGSIVTPGGGEQFTDPAGIEIGTNRPVIKKCALRHRL